MLHLSNSSVPRHVARTLSHLHCWQLSRQSFHNLVVEQQDIVLLKPKDDRAPAILTPPLSHKPGARRSWIKTTRGTVAIPRIIGSKLGDVVETNDGAPYTIHRPTLAEYVLYSRRLVQPIYPGDAELIVSLLDVHQADEAIENEAPFEILEAGTGQGALTLHLARAIHGFNNHPSPVRPRGPRGCSSEPEEDGADSIALEEVAANDAATPKLDPETDLEAREVYDKWMKQRRAVINTIDVAAAHSNHARRLIGRFRDGIYLGDINFHVGTVDKYIASRMEQSQEPFLDRVMLDMAQAEDYLPAVEAAMKPYGLLIVFYPNITQIMETMDAITTHHLKLEMEQVIELAQNGGTAGRQWDVKRIARRKPKTEVVDNPIPDVAAPVPTERTPQDDSLLVCRPKVSVKTVGGGFVGVWRRK